MLIEDNKLLRDGIASLLKKQPDMHVAAIPNGENIITDDRKIKSKYSTSRSQFKNQNSLNVVKLIKKNFQGN